MQLEWSKTQQEYRERFRIFADVEIAPGARSRDQEGLFDRQLWKKLADLGFWRVHIPQYYGGYGGTLWDLLAAFEGLSVGAVDLGFVLSAIAHAGLLQVIYEHGTEAQCKHWLPLLMSGGVGATAATEVSGGSDVAGVKTTARPAGDGYMLTGKKSHITNAPIADLVLVVGRIPSLGQRDITLFLVEKEASGVNLGRPEDLMGQRSSPTGSVVLEDAYVTANNIVGKMGNGLETLYSFLSFDRLMYGDAVAGFLEHILDQALERVSTRFAFETSIADQQYIQEKLVDMKLTMETSRWLAYSAAAALIRGDSGSSSMQASLAKVTASEGMVRAGLELIQIFGHVGYDRTNDIERVLRDAVAIRIAGGTTEMQKKNIFKHIAKKHVNS